VSDLAATDARPRVSIEVPVVGGAWLLPTIQSVLAQTSRDWTLHLLWDGGDALSKRILDTLAAQKNPQIKVFYTERMGIAQARRYLTQHSQGEWILPLDHDDLLDKEAVKRFLRAAETAPWAGIIRARRAFVDERGTIHRDTPDWFPFQDRHYHRGMTTDLFNHAQPMIIRRSAYQQTTGWEGYDEYYGAGEDCDMFLKIEEIQDIELLDDLLYYYRVHDKRTSNALGEPAALDMWRRLADKTIARRQLPFKRTNEVQPFTYTGKWERTTDVSAIDVVVPFWESDETEIEYPHRRPTEAGSNNVHILADAEPFSQPITANLLPLNRIDLHCSASAPVSGTLRVALYEKNLPIPIASAECPLRDATPYFETIPFHLQVPANTTTDLELKIEFHSTVSVHHRLLLHTALENGTPRALMRLYRQEPGAGRRGLERCLASLHMAGIPHQNIIIAEQRQSSAANRNTGFRAGKRPFVCYLDDDVEIIEPNALQTLLAAMHDLEADLAGPLLVDAEDRIFCADPYFDPEGMPAPRGLGDPNTGQFNYRNIVPWLPSTLLLTRRSVGLSIGPWNERYTGSQLEDVDYTLLARLRGFQCAYIGDATVRHYNLQRNYNLSRNLPYFRARWARHKHLFLPNQP